MTHLRFVHKSLSAVGPPSLWLHNHGVGLCWPCSFQAAFINHLGGLQGLTTGSRLKGYCLNMSEAGACTTIFVVVVVFFTKLRGCE